MDQQQDTHQPGSLAQLFAAADVNIERRRAENIFKQLDERSLTEDEEKIIQQRVEHQRKLLEEYEKREQKRKVAELQDMWPDLSEAAATRALELCNGKEEEAVLRLTEDATFKRRVMQETGTHMAATIVIAPKAGSRTRGASSGSSRSTTTRIISPSQMNGRVFVGRFRTKLGPYQVANPALQAALPSTGAGSDSTGPAAAAAAGEQQPKKRGRKRKAELAAIAAAAAADQALEAAPADAPAAQAAAAAQRQEAVAALAAAAPLPAGDEGAAPAAASGPGSEGVAADAAPTRKRQRSSSPSEGGATAGDTDAATDTEPEATAAAAAAAAGGVLTDSGADTDTGPAQDRQVQDQRQGRVSLHADRVVGMMARQIARLEPLVAAGRMLEFESRRPGSSSGVLEQLEAEYGQQVSVPIATAWEVLLEEQKLNASMGLAGAADAVGAAAAATTISRAAHSAVKGEDGQQAAAAGGGSVSSPRRQSRRQQQLTPRQQEQQRGQQDQQQQGVPAPAAAAAAAVPEAPSNAQQPAAAAAVAAAPACSDASTVSEQPGLEATTAAAAAGTPTSTRTAAAAAAAAGAEPETTEAAAGAGGSRGRSRRSAAAAAAAAVSAAAAADADAGSSRAQQGKRGSSKGSAGGGGGGGRAIRAISETGHTCRGRVRQKSHKTTELVEVGELRVAKDWYNAGYIFPEGFKSRLLFRSSVDTDALCLHECEIIGEGGKFWPAPTFQVTARDREDEPVVGKSCTGCWSQILKRINATISQRIAAGENLPPPPRTAIAGPEYFGLNDLSTIAAIEALDPDHLCSTYWEGKQQREAASAGLPVVVQPLQRNTGGSSGSGSARGNGRKRGRARESEDAMEGEGDDEGEEGGYKGNHWSAISRRERYLKRCTDAGDEALLDEDQNLLPGVLDPVTLEPVVNPAISPAGHVMGLATWKAVLSETGRCPFTKAPLRPDMLTVLTANNIEKHRARIVAMS